MDGIISLVELRRRIVWNILRTVGHHSRLKIASIIILGGAIWVSLYVFPYLGFRWISMLLRETTVSDMLISLFFFVLTVMLVFSNAVIAYTALFRSDETSFLRVCPLPSWMVFLYKLAESLAFSSWAFMLLGVPIMLAYGVHKLAPWYYYIAMFVYFAAFVLIPASAGALIALLISTVVRPWMRRALAWVLIVVALAVFILGTALAGRRRSDGGMFLATTLLNRVSFTHNVCWPSAWVSRGLMICAGTAGAGGATDALYYLGLLLSNSLFLCVVASAIAARWYPGAWDRIHSMSSRSQFRPFGLLLAIPQPRSPMFQLILKDLKTFVRDPVQWTQCAVLFGLLGLYILNLRNLRYPSEKQMSMWRNLTTFLNLGSISLVLATLTTRFVFPMFSLEGRRFWILGLMPVRRRCVLWGKFLFAFLSSLVITELLMVMSDIILAEPTWLIVVHVFTVAMISLGLSGMAVGLSALYPNLEETSPAKIVSGFGGTLNLILSMLYVSIVVAAEAVPLHLWRTEQIGMTGMILWLGASLGLLIVLTALAFGLPMWLGSRALARMEF